MVLTISCRVAEHWARGGPGETVGSLLATLTAGDAAVNEAIIRGLAVGWPKDHPATVDRSLEDVLKKLMVDLNGPARGQLVRLVGRWGNAGMGRFGAEIVGVVARVGATIHRWTMRGGRTPPAN